MLAWFQTNWMVLALVVEELLPLIPGVASNSIGQLVIAAIKQLLASEPSAPAAPAVKS